MFVGAALAWLALSGCESRFPVCKNSDECKERAEGDPQAKALVCADLRCVECRYDSDCKAGSTCTKNGECKPLGGPRPDYAEGGSRPE